MHSDLRKVLKRVLNWAHEQKSVNKIKLTGLSARRYPATDPTPDYQFTIWTNNPEFVEGDKWIAGIGHYLICVYDYFQIEDSEVESRLILFDVGAKIQFLFRRTEGNVMESGRIQYFGRTLNSNSSLVF